MDQQVQLAIAEALFQKFSAFHEIGELNLRGVAEVEVEGCLAQMILSFGPLSLVVVAVEDDDSIDFRCVNSSELKAPDGTDVSNQKVWSDLIGLPFGWGWMTVNQQGYCDGMLLSFSGINPQVVLNVVASSIKVLRIRQEARS